MTYRAMIEQGKDYGKEQAKEHFKDCITLCVRVIAQEFRGMLEPVQLDTDLAVPLGSTVKDAIALAVDDAASKLDSLVPISGIALGRDSSLIEESDTCFF